MCSIRRPTSGKNQRVQDRGARHPWLLEASGAIIDSRSQTLGGSDSYCSFRIHPLLAIWGEKLRSGSYSENVGAKYRRRLPSGAPAAEFRPSVAQRVNPRNCARRTPIPPHPSPILLAEVIAAHRGGIIHFSQMIWRIGSARGYRRCATFVSHPRAPESETE